MVRVRRDLKRSSGSNPPAISRDMFHQTRLLRAPSNLALNTAREGAATAFLGNGFQCLTTLTVKDFFLIICPLSVYSHSPLSYHYTPL